MIDPTEGFTSRRQSAFPVNFWVTKWWELISTFQSSWNCSRGSGRWGEEHQNDLWHSSLLFVCESNGWLCRNWLCGLCRKKSWFCQQSDSVINEGHWKQLYSMRLSFCSWSAQSHKFSALPQISFSLVGNKYVPSPSGLCSRCAVL